ncbi:ubiquitin domain-containing protein DSK2b-like [Rutidosis leptorrhynchoides]|uniref:ubiquitin domain-containing protein DSK2b-like n=1 Tax=Rutidosis leptorrhynchoides TaxID=125765 RepID=UPI003A9941E2
MTNGVDSSNSDTRESVTINVRCCSNSMMPNFSVQVSLEASVETFKSLIEQKSDIPAGQQQLMYKRRVLEDGQTLKSYGLKAEHTVHMVYGSLEGEGEGEGEGPSPIPQLNFMNQVYLDMRRQLTLNPKMMKAIMDLPDVQNEMAGNPQFMELQQQTQNPDKMQQVLDLPVVMNILLCCQPDVLMKTLRDTYPHITDDDVYVEVDDDYHYEYEYEYE